MTAINIKSINIKYLSHFFYDSYKSGHGHDRIHIINRICDDIQKTIDPR